MAAAVAEAAPQGHFAHGPAPEAQENKGKAKSRRAQRLAAIKVPPVVIHTRTSSSGSEVTMTYERLHELGKGGFARCFQFRCIERATDIAGKVVAKASLTRERARLKLLTEIRVHRAMTHARVVRFESFFEDDNNVYMMMELCPNGSLADMVRSRGALSETEARGYMLQLVDACRYLHHHGIIHRDLKLGNVFLAGDMTLRVGDFGLATKLMTKQERKRTVCGTPNYIAPEVLDAGEEGHSFEVDVWSLGVILYTMLVGRPPFETRDVKQTYALIRRASFDFPPSSHVSPEAKDLVRAMLTVDPAHRPPLTAVLRHPFFTGATAFVPVSMPASATSVAPYYPAGALAPAAEVASRMLATPPGALRRRIRVTGPGTERPDLAAPEAAPVIAAPPLGPPSSSSAHPSALRVAADDRLRRFQHKAAAAAHGPASAGQAAPPALRRVALAAVHDNDAGGRVARKRAFGTALGQHHPHPHPLSQPQQQPATQQDRAVGGFRPAHETAAVAPPALPSRSRALRGGAGGARAARGGGTSAASSSSSAAGAGAAHAETGEDERCSGGAARRPRMDSGAVGTGGGFGALGGLAAGAAYTARRNGADVGGGAGAVSDRPAATLITPFKDAQFRGSSPARAAADADADADADAAGAAATEAQAEAEAGVEDTYGRAPTPAAGAGASPRHEDDEDDEDLDMDPEAQAGSPPAVRPGAGAGPRDDACGGPGQSWAAESGAGARAASSGGASSAAAAQARSGPCDPVARVRAAAAAATPDVAARARTSSAGQASSRGGLARSHGSEASAGSPYTVAAPGTLARVVSALQRSLDPRASVIGPMGGSSGSAERQHAGHAADAAWSGASGQGAATSSSSAAAAAAAEAAATSSAAASAATQQAASAGSVPPGSSPQAASTPRVWVVKWVDYTSKYGLGFLLSDGSVGVHFMDLSKIVCASDGLHFEYCPAMPHGERPRDPVTGRRFVPSEAHTTEEYPAALQKKVTLLLHFRKYLLEHWERSVADGSAPEEEVRSIRAGSRTSGLVYLKKWLRTEHAAVFRLSDRTVQACFFDGSAVALSPDATGAMFTDKHGVRSRHALATVAEKGGPSVVKRLRYVKDLLNGLVQGATDA